MAKSEKDKRPTKTTADSSTVPFKDCNDCTSSVSSNSTGKNKTKSPKSK